MKSLLRLRPFIVPYWYLIAAGVATFAIARFFEIWTYYLVSEGIDLVDSLLRNDASGESMTLVQIAQAIIACVFFRFVFIVYARRGIRRVGISVSFDLRQKLYSMVQRQSGRFFEHIGVGDLMIRAIQDIALIQRLISRGTVHIVIMIYAPLFAVSAMLYKSPSLTLLILPLLPVIFVYAWYMAKKMAVSSQAVQEGLSALSSHTQENLSGIRTVQAQVQEENEIKRFWKTNDAYAKAFYEQSRINSLMSAWMPFFAQSCQLAIIVYGGSLALDGTISVGDLIFFLACLNMLLQPIRMAGMFVTLLQRAAVATRRLYEVFDAEPEISDEPSGKTPDSIKGRFEFRKLTFRYPGTAVDVLSDISLTINEGDSLAIVGRVGCGKSTLLKQFTRMLDTPQGQVFVDGHDVCDYPLSQLRLQIAQVLQDPFLFGEPLRNNISYDDPERRLELIWDSAEASALKGTIEAFPDKMDTLVGERGVMLSGGQKQRAVLARGLIRNAAVLILDDCFSSVDTETEEHILSRLKSRRKDKTTILVSHRVSTLRHFDRILVLEEGRIAELGSHEELIGLNGIYAELERAQTRGTNDVAGDLSDDVELSPV